MHLKDRTVVIVNSNVEEGNFVEEDFPAENVIVSSSNRDNQLRARPMVGIPMAGRLDVPVHPVVAFIRLAVVPPPGRPVVVPKPMLRGPVDRPGIPMGGVVFREISGMPMQMAPKIVFAQKPIVPVRPAVPIMKPVVSGSMMPKPMPVKPAVMPVRPGVPDAYRSMVVPARSGVFRVRRERRRFPRRICWRKRLL